MATLKDKLSLVDTKDLLRAYNSSKEYIGFEYFTTNARTVVKVICSDDERVFIRVNKQRLEDGVSFVVTNSYRTMEQLREVLKDRLKKLTKAWTRVCYEESWESFLSRNGLSEHKYKQLLKLENN